MGILGQMPLGQQRVDLLGREPVAELHGRLAGDHVQQIVQQVAGLGLLAAGEQFFHQVAEHVGRPPVGQHRRVARTSTVSPPKGCDLDAQLREQVGCSSTAAASEAARSTGSGTSSRCDSSAPASTLSRSCS